MTATPGQAADAPPALFARWCRVDTGPGTTDETIAERWRTAFSEDCEFWTELDAGLDGRDRLALRLAAVQAILISDVSAEDARSNAAAAAWDNAVPELAAPEVRIADCTDHDGASHVQINTRNHWLCTVSLAPILHDYEPQPEPKPAPELAAVRGEILAEVLAWIEDPAITRPGPGAVAGWRERAELPS